jgi:hypothetical protein
MLMRVRQQMICIIAPDWRGGAGVIQSNDMSEALKALFSDVGVVHFASIALLPALSDSPSQLPSLMLELAVEEGLRPYDLLCRLVNHPSGAMWSLYGRYWLEGERPVGVGQRNQELLDRLMDWHSVADGAFVGARDRSVRQIRKERDLLLQTRDAARELRADYGSDRATFALALARWAFARPEFDWATAPAPRSFWRGSGASIIAKAAYPAAIIALWMASVWLVGAVFRLAACVVARLLAGPDSELQTVLLAVSEASRYLLGASVRLLIALAVTALALWVLFGLLPALFRPWRRWIKNIGRELDRPTQTWSSLSTYVSVWVSGLPIVLTSIYCVVTYAFWPEFFQSQLSQWMPVASGLRLLAIITLFILFILLASGSIILFSWIASRLPKLTAWFYQPHEDDVERAQQVHPSIDASEAALVGGTAHLISLTDMRAPHWWSIFWTRASLRLVTFLGRVSFTDGLLGEAPGIHFGHWHVIDNGRRYLFCSNYDGNFGGYLDDFINGASAGTSLFWRWTKLMARAPSDDGQPGVRLPRAFPPTRFLVFRGVKCELKFKSYARDSMLPHLFRFDACDSTMDGINRATTVRDALFGERNDCNDDQIMRAIE